MKEIGYNEFLSMLYNGYNTKYHTLLNRRDTLNEARKYRGEGKAKSATVEALKIILEDFIDAYEDEIVEIEMSLKSIHKIISDGAPVAVDIFLRKYFELCGDLLACDIDELEKMYVISEELECREYQLATLGYPITGAYGVFIGELEKDLPEEVEE